MAARPGSASPDGLLGAETNSHAEIIKRLDREQGRVWILLLVGERDLRQCTKSAVVLAQLSLRFQRTCTSCDKLSSRAEAV